MTYQRILTIQDISCVGQCSLTVALPILSACGQETCILPSAVLSTHTGGSFKGFTFRDLSEDFPAIQKHWIRQEISFDAIYTGYLGSIPQIHYINDLFAPLLRAEGKLIVDPAMGDNGVLYYGFDEKYAAEMAKLCGTADVILPNMTEACMMTGFPYKEEYDEEYVNDVVAALFGLGAKSVILTGISYSADETGVYVCTPEEKKYYCHQRIHKSFHGTGDIYASSFVGSWLSGKNLFESAKIAANFTVESILQTLDDPDHWYGVKFEKALPKLIGALQ